MDGYITSAIWISLVVNRFILHLVSLLYGTLGSLTLERDGKKKL
jgi:hypothetical protein